MESFVYILRCNSRNFYTGMTLNPMARYQQHRNERVKSTKRYKGALYIDYLELVPIKVKKDFYSVTRKREKQIKRWSRDKKEKMIQLKRERTNKLIKEYIG